MTGPALAREGAGVTRLWLLRHAKSSWHDPGLPDRLRPLTQRGRKATAKLARHMESSRIEPELVLCSPAVRATQTWEGVRTGLPPGTRMVLDEAIYAAAADALFERVRRLPEEIESVLVIGHNPGLGDLAHELIGGGDPSLRERLATKFPTGALAGLQLPGAWQDLQWGHAMLDGYVVPRDLT